MIDILLLLLISSFICYGTYLDTLSNDNDMDNNNGYIDKGAL